MRLLPRCLFAAVAIVASAELALADGDQTIASCGTFVVTANAKGDTITLASGSERRTGVLEAVVNAPDVRVLVVTHVGGHAGWGHDLVIALVSAEPRGMIVLSGAGDRQGLDEQRGRIAWSTGADCPAVHPGKLVPTAATVAGAHTCRANELDTDFTADSYGEVVLTADARKLACTTYRDALAAEASYATKIGRFLVERRAAKISSMEDELDTAPAVAARLYDDCVALEHLGISTHSQGMILWPMFEAAQCFRHLAAVVDPAKQ